MRTDPFPAEEKAGRILAQELDERGWAEEELARRPKGDAEKVQVAQRLRRETSVTLKWIAERLQMGSWSHVSNLLSAARGKECKK